MTPFIKNDKLYLINTAKELILLEKDLDLRRVTLRMTAEKLRRLKIIAANEDTNINYILNTLVDEYLSKKAIEA